MRPSRSSRTSVKPGGISSTWWVTSTRAGASRSAASSPRRAHEVLAPAEVEAGGRLVEEHQLGVGHQGPGDLHPLALALAQRAEPAVGEVAGAQRLEQLIARRSSSVVVLLAPAPDDRVGRRDDDVADELLRGDPLGDRRAGQADPRAQLEHVDGAQDLAEDAGDPARRVDPGRGELQQRRLPGAVGSEHDPALALLDLPGDVVEQRVLPRTTLTPAKARTSLMGDDPRRSASAPSGRSPAPPRLARCRPCPSRCASRCGRPWRCAGELDPDDAVARGPPRRRRPHRRAGRPPRALARLRRVRRARRPPPARRPHRDAP